MNITDYFNKILKITVCFLSCLSLQAHDDSSHTFRQSDFAVMNFFQIAKQHINKKYQNDLSRRIQSTTLLLEAQRSYEQLKKIISNEKQDNHDPYIACLGGIFQDTPFEDPAFLNNLDKNIFPIDIRSITNNIYQIKEKFSKIYLFSSLSLRNNKTHIFYAVLHFLQTLEMLINVDIFSFSLIDELFDIAFYRPIEFCIKNKKPLAIIAGFILMGVIIYRHFYSHYTPSHQPVEIDNMKILPLTVLRQKGITCGAHALYNYFVMCHQNAHSLAFVSSLIDQKGFDNFINKIRPIIRQYRQQTIDYANKISEDAFKAEIKKAVAYLNNPNAEGITTAMLQAVERDLQDLYHNNYDELIDAKKGEYPDLAHVFTKKIAEIKENAKKRRKINEAESTRIANMMPEESMSAAEVEAVIHAMPEIPKDRVFVIGQLNTLNNHQTAFTDEQKRILRQAVQNNETLYFIINQFNGYSASGGHGTFDANSIGHWFTIEVLPQDDVIKSPLLLIADSMGFKQEWHIETMKKIMNVINSYKDNNINY